MLLNYCLLRSIWWKFLFAGPSMESRPSIGNRHPESGQKEALRIFKWHVCCTIDSLLFGTRIWTAIWNTWGDNGRRNWPTFQVIPDWSGIVIKICSLLLLCRRFSLMTVSMTVLSCPVRPTSTVNSPTHREPSLDGAEIIGADSHPTKKLYSKMFAKLPTNSMPFLWPAQQSPVQLSLNWRSVLGQMQILPEQPILRNCRLPICANRKTIKAKGSADRHQEEECEQGLHNAPKPFYGSTRISDNGSLGNVYRRVANIWLMILVSGSSSF